MKAFHRWTNRLFNFQIQFCLFRIDPTLSTWPNQRRHKTKRRIYHSAYYKKEKRLCFTLFGKRKMISVISHRTGNILFQNGKRENGNPKKWAKEGTAFWDITNERLYFIHNTSLQQASHICILICCLLKIFFWKKTKRYFYIVGHQFIICLPMAMRVFWAYRQISKSLFSSSCYITL